MCQGTALSQDPWRAERGPQERSLPNHSTLQAIERPAEKNIPLRRTYGKSAWRKPKHNKEQTEYCKQQFYAAHGNFEENQPTHKTEGNAENQIPADNVPAGKAIEVKELCRLDHEPY